ncbi:TetR family transcriptional regulator [Rhodanobacter thiooxydans]|uniref:TetR family transcriptional regulator n=2 Tax=Rhodanobacter TaxID=75309 RepID=A0A154QD21_9GAMM|nr:MULTISPECIES: TetR/AcrR family transcriptional regulator [Rhodanobacter]AGG90026.1 transcriptional regulator [Rhodanobacter denitrificans]KZC22080.1 TetR family transcriptional regulator [Rhodanobacter thiooxydans]UJM85417.1 TetR/AcrR family transcriptional regulator [Rhodanobacter denitrificans]
MATSTKRAKAGRRAGRPSGDDLDLRARLLDVAIAQFARAGIGATSLRAIAGEAEVTPAMLHYYFGDKPRLVQALVEERLLPALAPLRVQLERAGDDPRVLIEAFVRGIGEVVARHPWLPPLWVREVLCDGGALREVLFTQAVPGLPQLLAQRFAAAQANGRLNASMDPRLLVVSLVGLTLFPAAGAPIWRRMFGAEGLESAAMSQHTLALLGHGVGTRKSGEAA